MMFNRVSTYLLLSLTWNGLGAQTGAPVNPFVIHYDRSQYHAGNQNWSVAADNTGTLYVGNNDGLLEFDGSNWNLHVAPNRIVVRSVSTGIDGKIYIGGYEEFGYYVRDDKGLLNYHSLSSRLAGQEFHNDEIWRIILLGGKVYFQSFSAIFVYDGQNMKIIRPEQPIVLIMRVRDRLFVHMIGQGLYEIINDNLIRVPGSEILSDDEVKIAFPSGKDGIIFGSIGKGLFLYDEKGFRYWDVPANHPVTLAEVNVGLIADRFFVIGTIVDGIFILDQQGNLKQHLHEANGLQNNTILALALDPEDNIWAGLDRGVDQLVNTAPIEYHIDQSGKLGTVFDAALFEGHLWMGTNRGLFRLPWPPGNGYSDEELIEGSQGQVWDLEVKDGELIMGHTSGTYKVSGEKLEMISDINGGFDLERLETETGTYLIQSTYNVLTVYENKGNGWKFSHTIRGFLEPAPQIEIDHFGNIWTAHAQHGVYKIKLNTALDSVVDLEYFGTEEGFRNDRKLGLSKVEGRITISSSDIIYTYDDLKDTIIPYQNLNDHLGEYQGASQVIPAGRHLYWFIRKQKIGLFRIDGNTVKKQFSTDLSQQGIYMDDTRSRIVMLNDSLHLICLERGFALYDQAKDRAEGHRSNIMLRKVIAESSGKEVRWLPLKVPDNGLAIPFRFRNLSFTYSTSPQTRHPAFQYVLEGLEPDWSRWSETSQASFTRLPPGRYSFRVRSMKRNGDAGPVITYAFRILAPWYISRIALLVYILILAGAGWMTRKLFIKRLRVHAAKMEAEKLEKIRQQKILAEQRFTKLNNEVLQSEIRHKNKQLADYTMNVIRKNELLMKIKNELEEQKKELGERYPNYMYERLMRHIDKNMSSEDEWKVFEYHFDQTHENFFKRLKSDYPGLTPGDLKLCAYLRLNLSSKELAPLLNIGIKSVEVHRSRLRKKLDLKPDENLVDFLLGF